MISEDNTNQKQNRNDLRNNEVFKTGSQSPFILGKKDQTRRCNDRKLEKNEEIKNIASQDYPA